MAALTRLDGLAPLAEWGDDGSRLVRLLRTNKFPLLALAQGSADGSSLADSPAWKAALEEDRALYSSLRDEYVAVKRAWSDAGIPCIVFKSAGTHPAFPYTSDNLDLLVPRDRCHDAKAILQDLGYIWLKNIDETQKFLFRKFRGGRSVSAIHVHSWVGWDVEFHEDVIWDGARVAEDDPEVLVPAPEDAILINVAHALYENKQFNLYDVEKVRSQWGKEGLDWSYMEGVARRRGWLDGLYFALLVTAHLERNLYGASTAPDDLIQRWERGLRRSWVASRYWGRLRKRRPVRMPFSVSFPFSKLLYYQKILRDQHDWPRQRLSNLYHTLVWGLKQKSGIRPQPGMLVSLSGLDGCGKTAHVKGLSEALTVSGVKNRVVWSRPGCSPLYRSISRIGRGLIPGAKRLVTTDRPRGPAEANGRGGRFEDAFRSVWASINALDMLLVYWLRVGLPLLTGKVAICDRYVYDTAVELRHRLGASSGAGHLSLRLLEGLSPKPKAAYLLDVPADVAAERSANPERVADMERQRRLYLKIANRHGLLTKDASQDFDSVNDTLVREVLRKYMDDFHTLLNGLLLSNPSQLNRDKLPSSPTKGLIT